MQREYAWNAQGIVAKSTGVKLAVHRRICWRERRIGDRSMLLK